MCSSSSQRRWRLRFPRQVHCGERGTPHTFTTDRTHIQEGTREGHYRVREGERRETTTPAWLQPKLHHCSDPETAGLCVGSAFTHSLNILVRFKHCIALKVYITNTPVNIQPILSLFSCLYKALCYFTA